VALKKDLNRIYGQSSLPAKKHYRDLKKTKKTDDSGPLFFVIVGCVGSQKTHLVATGSPGRPREIFRESLTNRKHCEALLRKGKSEALPWLVASSVRCNGFDRSVCLAGIYSLELKGETLTGHDSQPVTGNGSRETNMRPTSRVEKEKKPAVKMGD